eukprot:5330381-Amphidinium_carterae.1
MLGFQDLHFDARLQTRFETSAHVLVDWVGTMLLQSKAFFGFRLQMHKASLSRVYMTAKARMILRNTTVGMKAHALRSERTIMKDRIMRLILQQEKGRRVELLSTITLAWNKLVFTCTIDKLHKREHEAWANAAEERALKESERRLKE